MSERKVYCGDELIEVRRWLRPAMEIAAGAMVPFMVSKEHAQFVRDHEDDPFVVRTADEGWSLRIISVEATGTEGVWVSAKAVSKVSSAPTMRASPERGLRGTLMGAPVPGLGDPPENELPEGDAGETAPLGLDVIRRRDDD